MIYQNHPLIGSLPQFQVAALAFRIIPELQLTSSQFALIMSAPMLPAVLLSLVAGSLADRFGVKKVVAVGFAFSAFNGFFPNALNAVRGVDPVTAGLLAAIVTIGTMVGSIVGPAMSDRIGLIKPFLAPVAILGAVAMYASWIVPTGPVMWITLFLPELGSKARAKAKSCHK